MIVLRFPRCRISGATAGTHTHVRIYIVPRIEVPLGPLPAVLRVWESPGDTGSVTMNRGLLAMLLLPALCCTGQAEHVQFYIAPNGDDSWSGRQADPVQGDGPFRTILRARDAIREFREAHADPGGFTVSIHPGVYRQTSTLVFEPQDSGTERCPVRYEAYGKERPVLSGGIPITGWEPAPDVGAGVWKAERRTRARNPNEGFFLTAGRSGTYPKPRRMFRFDEGCFDQWEGLSDAAVIAYHSWNAAIHWIESVDLQSRIVTLTNRGATRPFGGYRARVRYYVENYLEALDAPGEWFLKRDGTLYYRPLDDEDLSRATVIAPLVKERLIELRGDLRAGEFVEHLTLKGLSLRHLGWTAMKDTWYDHQDFSSVRWAGVYATGAANCHIEDCEIANIGAHGVYLDRGCRNNTVSRCHIHDTGGGGVYLGPRDQRAEGDEACEHNVVDNNFIHDTGHVFPGVVGVFLGCVAHNQVSHNEICDNDWSGMSIGWKEREVGANVIEYNHIHHVGRQILGDMAGIYTQGVSPGTLLRNNVIHDVYGYPHGTMAHGLYHDGNSGGYTSENNVVYNISAFGLFQGGTGENNTIRNNIFAFCDGGGLRTSSRNHPSCVIERNIVLNRDTFEIAARDWKQVRFDGNLYWKLGLGVGVLRFQGKDFASWQQAGHDAHSVIADPKFVDPENRDFRLAPDSPARKLGFRDIDTSTVGLYGDAEWTRLPEAVDRVRPAYQEPPPKTLDDDFEAGGVGEQPVFLDIIAEQKGTIRISDEAARAGTKSLKFTDVPGLTASFYPYTYDLGYHYDSGTVEFSFDLMNSSESPGKPSITVRDHLTPRHSSFDAPELPDYFAGPTIGMDGDGTLRADGKAVTKVPLGTWAHICLSIRLGDPRATSYGLSVDAAGDGTAMELPLPDPRFAVISGVYFIADDKPEARETTFYVDNVKLKSTPE